jgi:hypothetical protein
VCLWFVNPNTCWYNYGMHPGNLDCVYSPQEGDPGFVNQALARRAEEVVAAGDPQGRPVYTYASGNFGPLYSAMQYFSLGLPLQEEADWPSVWAEAAGKPLIPVETDLKWTPHWQDFEAVERSWVDRSPIPVYYVEHAARYLGDAPYRQTDHPAVSDLAFRRPEGTLWNNLAAEPYVLEARALAARDILRGWRGYGMSGMTFHAEEDDLFETWSRLGETFPEHTPAELQTPGPKPELKYQWFPRYYHADRPNQPFHESFRRNFQPLLAFIGGATLEPERKLGEFTAKDHAYYAGETVAKQVVIVNDRTDRDLHGRYEWRVTQAGEVVASGDGAAEVGSGRIAHLPFRFVGPPVTVRTDLKIELELTEGNETVGDDSFDLQAYPQPKASPADEPVALLDTSDGRTGKALQAAGAPFAAVTSAAELASRRSIVVGQGALPEVAATLADLETAGRLAQGANILILAQPPCALLNLIHEPAYERYVWPRDAGHPVLAGISGDELANWRGASAMCSAYPPPDPATKNSPHYPGLKWHWGNRGIVSTYPLRKPTYGNFRVLADDGFDLTLSPLIEWLAGPSRIVLCQLDLAERAGSDPVATELLRRLCAYVRSAEPPTWRTARYTGSEEGRRYLAPHRLQDSARVLEEGVIVSDGDVPQGQRDTLLSHADGGGTVLLVNPSVGSLRPLASELRSSRSGTRWRPRTTGRCWRASAPRTSTGETNGRPPC